MGYFKFVRITCDNFISIAGNFVTLQGCMVRFFEIPRFSESFGNFRGTVSIPLSPFQNFRNFGSNAVLLLPLIFFFFLFFHISARVH